MGRLLLGITHGHGLWDDAASRLSQAFFCLLDKSCCTESSNDDESWT